jgi:hypothetical protein
MRLLRARLTIRRMMVVVAAIAIILGIGVTLRRSYRYRRIAEYHRIGASYAAAQKVVVLKATIDERFNDQSGAIQNRLFAEWIGRMGSFHFELRWKYSQVAWRPWQSLDPDPSPPPYSRTVIPVP